MGYDRLWICTTHFTYFHIMYYVQRFLLKNIKIFCETFKRGGDSNNCTHIWGAWDAFCHMSKGWMRRLLSHDYRVVWHTCDYTTHFVTWPTSFGDTCDAWADVRLTCLAQPRRLPPPPPRPKTAGIWEISRPAAQQCSHGTVAKEVELNVPKMRWTWGGLYNRLT